ncbi:MAG: TonB-dependent receptor [Xanthomonadales bacterium]|nr:TonB-dependent receptor [Xanthomonadales bacterium]
MKSFKGNDLANSHRIREFGKLHKFIAAVALATMSVPVFAQQENNRLEEVIVTAQKREQSIQDVSVSITAFSNSDIRELGIGRPRDLARYTPGLVMNASNGGETDTVFTLRGVGMNDVASNQNPAISVYIDDVALAAISMLGFQIFDQERIEVLKGPQGTLYGRNTTGGAIKFISRKPTREFDAFGQVDYGSYNRIGFEGAVGGSLGPTLSGRLAVGIVEQPKGWQTLDLRGLGQFGPGVDANNGAISTQGIRGSLMWEPSDKVDVLLVADYGETDSESQAFQHAGNRLIDNSGFCSFTTIGVRDETQCASFGQVRDVIGGTPLTPQREIYSETGNDPRTVGSNFGQGNDIKGESWGLSGTIDVGLQRSTFTSVTGFRKMDRLLAQDQGASPFQIHDLENIEDIESFSQEIRLASDDSWGALTWLVGAYYSDDDINAKNNTDFRDHISFNSKFFLDYTQKTKLGAVFAQAEWAFNDNWRLIGGLRYTDVSRDFRYDSITVGISPKAVTGIRNNIDDSEVSGRIGLDYTVSDDLLLYASFNRGFKGGGFSGSINFNPNGFTPYKSETLDAFEAGFKWTLADGALRFNSAVYYYDWMDFQAATAVDIGGIRIIVLSNAGDAEILGLESEISWYPTEQFSLNLGFNWMDAEIVSGNFDGDTPAHAPKVSFNGIAKYESTSSIAGVRPFAQVGFSYQDDIQFILANHPGATEKAYTLLDARIGFKSEDGHWEYAAYGHNLTDKLYRTEVFGPGSGFLPSRIFYGPPRTFGVSVSYFY